MQSLSGMRARQQALRPQLADRRALCVTAAVKASSGKHVVCSKTLIAKEGKAEVVAGMCKEVVEFSMEALKDRKSGIVQFQCVKDGWEPNTFHFYERYESNAAMGRHNTEEKLTAFMKKVQPHLEGPVGMALYGWQDGKLSNVCLQGGPKGEGGLDDATGASGAAGGASLKQSSSTVDLTNMEEEDEDDLASSVKKQVDSFKNMFSAAFGGGKK